MFLSLSDFLWFEEQERPKRETIAEFVLATKSGPIENTAMCDMRYHYAVPGSRRNI